MSLLLLDTTSSSSSVRSKKLIPSSSGKFGVAGDRKKLVVGFGVAGDRKKLVAGLIRGRSVSNRGREGITADAGTLVISSKLCLEDLAEIGRSEFEGKTSAFTDSEERDRLK